MKTPKPVVGLVWYRLEDYADALAIMEDRDQLPATYSLWRMKAEQAEKEQQRLGRVTVRAYINPAEFAAWCKALGLNVNAEIRNRFAVLVASQTTPDLD